MRSLITPLVRRMSNGSRPTIYGFTATSLDGKEKQLSDYQGKENCQNDEILSVLKYVRPGQGYEPQFPIFSKVTVNGKDSHPLYTFLKSTLPFPSDLGAGAGSVLMNDPKGIIWSPVRRYDISWNFEKFLIGQDGVPVGRYSPKLPPADLASDIEKLL